MIPATTDMALYLLRYTFFISFFDIPIAFITPISLRSSSIVARNVSLIQRKAIIIRRTLINIITIATAASDIALKIRKELALQL